MSDSAGNHTSLAGLAAGVGIAQGAKSSGMLTVRVNSLDVQMHAARDVTFAAGDRVAFVRAGATWVAVARAGTAAVADQPDAAVAPPANPPTVFGSTAFVPAEYGNWQDTRWSNDTSNILQGQATTSAPNNTGTVFYQNAFRALAGATASAARVQIRRSTRGGKPGALPLTLWLVTQTTRPLGAPTLTDTTVGPLLAWGQSTSFTIPTAWAQAMIDGTAGGLAVFESDGSPYIALDALGNASQFALTVDWSR